MDKNPNCNKTDNNEMESLKESSTKIKNKNRGKKRKRRPSDSSSEYEEVLPENALEIENNLHASAVKNNLDEISVRKILKKVVTNDHVLALVKLREEEEDSGPEESSLRPKLTRAKVKELMKVSPKAAPWNLENLELTPIKHIPVKTRPEVKALIAQELPDDEDDEEYEPTHDDIPSDDDQGLESCSDVDSQPRTPATPKRLHSASPKVVKDGPFKVPQEVSTPTRRKLNLEEEATIALRTRSKLSLSATSIEHIESTFVPPDDLPMPAVDDLWNEFLSECLNPASTSKHEDDDETDPEYNVAADPDAHDEDEEALGNSLIKISKKELNDLVTELFNIIPETATDDELLADNLAGDVLTEHNQTETSNRWEGKQEPVSDEEQKQSFSDRITFEKRGYTRRLSMGKTEPSDPPQEEEEVRNGIAEREEENTSRARKTPRSVDVAIEEREDEEEREPDGTQGAPPSLLRRYLSKARTERVTIKVDEGVTVLPEQIAILQQQLRQHIQLATSNYLQLYIHPEHWRMAPPFKEYLETLNKLGQSNPKSVVNVCNLKPALELANTWEKTVSVNTPENKQMVEFIMKESERCRRRFSHKSLYTGEFHDTFMAVVANSPVFLYPYLLPPMPFRSDNCKRYAYTRSEDELIALGLDQFCDYVRSNPSIFKLPPTVHPRQRQGLTVTLQLVMKYMFPWIPYKGMLAHIQFVRKSATASENPICNFFKNNIITPVKHKLLPFNPKLTLYEQPEHEVPRIWVRYLSKTSKRFRNHLLRRTNVTGLAPVGVEVQLGETVTQPEKAPLPIDFTKEIVSNRINLLPKVTQPALTDKFDIQIANTVANNNQAPICNLYKLVETSTAAYLMPMSYVTVTVNSNNGPITTPAVLTPVVPTNAPESSKVDVTPENLGNKEHCSCCILLRKICKVKQTVITDYFRRNKPSVTCYCKDIKYPKISNRLKILVSNYKNSSTSALEFLDAKLKRLKKKDNANDADVTNEDNAFDMNDYAFVTSFHLKLLTRMTSARDTLIKRRVQTIISKFNPNVDDPVVLTKKLSEAFRAELIDMYKEFLCFLTPEQADIIEAFRDYFVRNCVKDLLERIEKQVASATVRLNLLKKLHHIFFNNLLTACQICTSLLSALDGYPELAQYVFSLFPHRKKTRSEKQAQATLDPDPDDTVCDQSHGTMDYEADHSASEEEDNERTNLTCEDENNQPRILKSEITTPGNEIQSGNTDQRDFINNMQQDSCDSSNASMTIVFDEDSVKPEAIEWKREEDKLILEVLKEHVTPEERKDKTIIEMLNEKHIIDMIADSLTDKSKTEVTSRVLYLLEMLVLSEK
ncbi:unnamed protein product [Arctia plantaginis]|uniref:GON-4-like protein n=1 Tax=Arctia plantaginis TaxID=874455 RepID=A0A8S1A2B1_ARCPL|nr:unnamed protein product [Arctia plantaginis]